MTTVDKLTVIICILSLYLVIIYFMHINAPKAVPAVKTNDLDMLKLNTPRRILGLPRLCGKHIQMHRTTPGIIGLIDPNNCDVCKTQPRSF